MKHKTIINVLELLKWIKGCQSILLGSRAPPLPEFSEFFCYNIFVVLES